MGEISGCKHPTGNPCHPLPGATGGHNPSPVLLVSVTSSLGFLPQAAQETPQGNPELAPRVTWQLPQGVPRVTSGLCDTQHGSVEAPQGAFLGMGCPCQEVAVPWERAQEVPGFGLCPGSSHSPACGGTANARISRCQRCWGLSLLQPCFLLPPSSSSRGWAVPEAQGAYAGPQLPPPTHCSPWHAG